MDHRIDIDIHEEVNGNPSMLERTLKIFRAIEARKKKMPFTLFVRVPEGEGNVVLPKSELSKKDRRLKQNNNTLRVYRHEEKTFDEALADALAYERKGHSVILTVGRAHPQVAYRSEVDTNDGSAHASAAESTDNPNGE